jgi:hypothetical protein
LLVTLIAGVAIARPADADERRVAVNDRNGDEIAVTILDHTLTVQRYGAHEETVTVDLSAIGDAIESALARTQDALAELDDAQLTVRLGSRNRVRLETSGSCAVVDIDAVMEGVDEALEEALAGLRDLHVGDRCGRDDGRDERGDARERAFDREAIDELIRELAREFHTAGSAIAD